MVEPSTPPASNSIQRFFAELKRREVFRVAAVYGATGFVVLQVADLLAEGLGLPEVVLRTATFLVLIGFPIALVLAWAYERTAEGVKRTDPAATAELDAIVAEPAAKRWPAGLLALAGVAALVAGAWWVGRSTAPGDAGAQPDLEAHAETVTRTADADPASVRKAVAVLPFADLAGTDDSRSFALGLHDDLMTQLTQVPELKVTSRTSVMAYADQTRPIREIASELGVGSIVEGGVRTSGGRVRLNVQLIDPSTDEHLWAQTFDRELTAENVFEIQGEIARAVATALEAELSVETGAALGTMLTDDIEAWNAYHAGKLLEDRQDDEASELRTIELFERAVELDPGFTAAWARLVRAQAWLLRRGLSSDTLPSRRSLDRLRAIDPDGPDTRFAEGSYQYYAIGDYEAALAAFEDGLRIRPGDSEFLQFTGWVLRRLGRWDEALARIERAIELDPRNSSLLWNQGLNYYRLQNLARGRLLIERAIGLDPAGSSVGGWLVELELFTAGDSAAARRAFDAGLGMESPGIREGVGFWLAYAHRDWDTAIERADRMTGGWAEVETSSTNRRSLSRAARLALAYRMAGNADSARSWSDSAVAEARAALAARPAPEPRDRFGVASVAHASLGHALAVRGGEDDLTEAIRHGEQALRLYGYEQDAMDSDFAAWLLARIYVLAGEDDRAFAWLEELLSRPTIVGHGDLAFDPLYDGLRDDPRFTALLRTIEGRNQR